MEKDIRECANACDAYSKKKLIAKVLKGQRWDDVLEHFVRRFEKRRADIEFAMAVHLGINIDLAHRKLDTLDAKYATLPNLRGSPLIVALLQDRRAGVYVQTVHLA